MQYLSRVAVQVATATGRGVGAVIREPLALNLWTWWQVRVMEEEARVERLGERVDAAAMTALAFHEPKRLAVQEQRYLRAAGVLGPMMDAAMRQAREMAAKVGQAKVTRSVVPRR